MDFNPYRIEPVRRNSRRCIGHDYCEPCIYMITATERPGRPALAFVNASAVMERTTIGEAVYQEIVGIHGFHPQIVVYALVVMPDHIHIVMHVKERLPKPLGQVLNGFGRRLLTTLATVGRFAGCAATFQAFQRPHPLA